MYLTPLTWYEQENFGHKAHLRPSPEHCGSCVSSRCKLHHKDTARRSYGTVHTFIKPAAQRFRVRLATAYADMSECVVTKECYMIESSCF
jgi:hypothetical protein